MSIQLAAKALREEASIVDLLSRLGYEPAKKSGHEKFYISMIRDDDNNPSFTVNDDLGVWFDHGIRKGGNIIDFGLIYWKNLRFSEVVQKLTELVSQPLPDRAGTVQIPKRRQRIAQKVPNYIVEETKALGTHPAITDYLKSRGVFQAGKNHLTEVYYYVEDDHGTRKHYFAAGWLNENRGWEVRNKYFKGCIGPQGITFIKGDNKKLAVFEGFMNFLSWRRENPSAEHSVIVLNSISLLKTGIEKAKAFSHIDLYFDRDKGGHISSRDFIAALPYATDRSKIYEGYNDYNDKIKADIKQEAAQAKASKDFFAGIKVPFER